MSRLNQQTLFGAMPMERKARVSQCGTYRYTLERRWCHGTTRVCWIMLNPSTADAKKDDPTVKRCIHFSKAWGYDSLRIVNIYPYRSPSPTECREWAQWDKRGPDWYARDALHLTNWPIVEESIWDASFVVAAWGAHEWAQDDISGLFEVQMCDWPIDRDLNLHCLGTTKHGHPKHPMARGKHRVPDDQQPVIWRQVSRSGDLESYQPNGASR